MTAVKTLILSLLAIVILGFATLWYFNNLFKPLSEADLPKFEMPEVNPLSLEEKDVSYKKFTTPDQKLEMYYPSNWMKMENNALESFNQSMLDTRAKNLLFVQGFKIDKGALAFLMVQELVLEGEDSLEKIIEDTKEGIEERGGEIEITNSKIEDNEAYLEFKYKEAQSSFIYSKEKLILAEDKVYLVIISNFNNDWSEFEEEKNEILNSARLVD